MAFAASSSEEQEAEPIGGLLEAVLAEMGLSQKMLEFRILAEWENAVGPQMAKWSQAKRVNNGRLEVVVKSAVWRTQLSFVKQEIVDRLNKKLGKKVVRELVLLNQR